jgi:2-oxoglutarate dehydrogenase E1 component
MQQTILELMRSSGHISGSNAEYVEELYENFLADPVSVSEEWNHYFSSLANGSGAIADVSHSAIRRDFKAHLL